MELDLKISLNGVNMLPVHVMNAYERVEVQLHSFVILTFKF